MTSGYACEGCGYRTKRWMGFCPQCKTGSLRETALAASKAPAPLSAAVAQGGGARKATGIGEVDRVLGGGVVSGGAMLVGGEPGVGKSTLLLQVAGSLAMSGNSVLLASAEESPDQVAMRAERLGAPSERIMVLAEPSVETIVAAATDLSPDLLVVDSIQTVTASDVDGTAGGVSQVRECAFRLVRLAKSTGVPVVLVGHVTKDGGIAGPKLLEHMVDVVLYLEGEAHRGLRFLRCLKNRFGAAHEVGLFEMGDEGLTELKDPAAALLSGGGGRVPGTALFPAMEGRRPLMVEVQALVAPATTPQPRRSVKGIEAARLHQLLAVLERHAGVRFGGQDVYVNVVGGVRLREPASDLPVALALVSSLWGVPLGPLAAWGEVGLTGEVRAVGQAARRREEATRLDVAQMLAPEDKAPLHIADAIAAAGLAGSDQNGQKPGFRLRPVPAGGK